MAENLDQAVSDTESGPARVPPLREGDLPEMRSSFWKMIGPGAIMVGLAVGSGELVLWPWITARFGATMAWAPLLAVVLQVFITIEIGRWAVSTGESAMRGMSRAWMGIIYLYLGFLFVLTMLPGWGRLTAATVRFLIFGNENLPWEEGSFLGTDWFWSLPVTLCVWAALFGPTKVYDGMERLVTIMVAVIFVGLIVVAVHLGTRDTVNQFTAGVLSFPPQVILDDDRVVALRRQDSEILVVGATEGARVTEVDAVSTDVTVTFDGEQQELRVYRMAGTNTVTIQAAAGTTFGGGDSEALAAVTVADDKRSLEAKSDFNFMAFFGALVFAGAGGFGLMFYSYYLRDKGIGMGERFPMLSVGIRDKTERKNETGYIFGDDDENARRFRDWFAYVKWDTILFFGVASVVTLLLFMFASLVALYQQPRGFGQGTLIWDLSTILGSTMGVWGRYMFLLVAIAALFSTILANTDGGCRMWTDMIHLAFPSTQRWTSGQMYAPIIFITWPISFISLWYFETHSTILDFFFINAAINGIAMSIFTPTVLYLNMKYLPKTARPGPASIVGISCATALFAGFSVYLIATYAIKWAS